MEAVLFFSFAAVALAGALGMVLARNPVHSALFLVMTMVTIAVFFLMLDADLVAAIQIVVYASAIVVLFLFVIMLLGVDRSEAFESGRSFQRVGALVAGLLLLAGVLVLAGREWVTGTPQARGAIEDGSNVQQLARTLFTDFFWAFEVTAALLVIAVVGAVVLARRSRSIAAPAETAGGRS